MNGVETFKKFGLPALAVLETIATKGKSPGTTAMTQQQIFRQAELDKERQRQEALDRRLKEAQISQLEGRVGGVAMDERRMALEKQLGLVKTQEEAEELIDRFQRESDPYGYYTGKQKERVTTEQKESERQIKAEKQLRDEFDKKSSDFTKLRDSYVRVQESAADPSAAGDLAIIFNYMKILDPGSVVRESEFATAQNAAGVPERVRAFYNNVIRGERLSPITRADFVNRAGRLYSGQARTQQRLIDRYSKLAQRKGVDPEDVVTPISITAAAPMKAPTATGTQVKQFNTVEEAEAANLPKGTIVIIAGRRAVIE